MLKETDLLTSSEHNAFEYNRSLKQDLTFDFFTEYSNKKGLDVSQPKFKNLGLIDSDGHYTNLALLLSAQCPFTTKCAVFNGTTRTSFMSREEFGGSILSQYEEAFTWIMFFNGPQSVFQGLARVDIPPFPVEAVRETLLNNFVHRDYSLNSFSTMSLFHDRIEAITPGGLAHKLILSDALIGVTSYRNPKLANVFFRLGVVEAYGTGLLKILDAYEGTHVQPTFEGTHAFKVTLPKIDVQVEYPKETTEPKQRRAKLAPQHQSDETTISTRKVRKQKNTRQTVEEPSYNDVMEERIRLIKALFAGKDLLTRKEIQAGIALSTTQIVAILNTLIEKKILERVGKGPATKYRFIRNT